MTTIVAVKTTTEIYFGADSKSAWGNSAALACKIFRCNDLYCAMTGLAYYQPTKFHFEESVNYGLRQAGTIKQRIDSFAYDFIPNFQTALVHMKDNNPNEFCSRTTDKTFLAGFIFALFQDNLPKVFNVGFKREGDSLEFVHIVNEAIIPQDKTRIAACDGHSNNIRSFLNANPAFIQNNLPVDIIDVLIGLEIVRNANSAGPPVDLLKITHDGPTWLRRKPGCFEI